MMTTLEAHYQMQPKQAQNTVGCLVNGKVFLPHAEGLSPPCKLLFTNLLMENSFLLWLSPI